MSLDERTLETIGRLRNDLPLFAETCLKVRNKAGEMVPLKFNRPQMVLHEALEKQKRETGMVRMLVPKARRAGISTYIGARYYHRTAMNKLINTYIMSHEQPSSDTLFNMVDMFQENNPLAPSVGASNVKELVFDKLGSRYQVATAGARETGRGMSITLFHGSEAAFWTNAAGHFASSVQAVPMLPGTEIILESTSAGPSGEFYERVMNAVRGEGIYRVCFLPWTIDTDNEMEPIRNLELSTETGGDIMSEAEYAKSYRLTPRQIAFKRFKTEELRNPRIFHREFPADISLAFISADSSGYHDASDVLRARKNPQTRGEGPLIMGVDPAGEGGDRFAIAFRRGHVVEEILYRNKVSTPEAATWIIDLIETKRPDAVYIDAGGLGAGIISLVRSTDPKYGIKLVKAVNFGAASQWKLARPKMPGPKNRRAEMQMRLKEWLSQDFVSIPDMDELQADLLVTKIKPNANNDLLLESKHDIRARGERSPDLCDAVGLTFAEGNFIKTVVKREKDAPTVPARQVKEIPEARPASSGGKYGWMS